jgi:hypothetical protein
MWEYNRFEIKHSTINELIDELNKLGADNWEIIFYEEKKPEKFGDNWITTILVKRSKTSML